MSWYVQLMGETVGPYSGAELKKMADAKRIEFDTAVARSKSGPWMQAQRIAGLFGAVETPAAQAAASRSTAAVPREEPVPETQSSQPELPDAQSRYKVLTQRDRWFGGRFEVEKLEDAINAYAALGWKICGVATTLVTGLAGKREEVVVVMEREQAAANGG